MRINNFLRLFPLRTNFQFYRTGVVLKRLYEPKLYERSLEGKFITRLREESYAYKVVHNTISEPAGDIDVILCTDVDGLGFEGDVVKVPRKLARGHMLLTKVARYASEENLRKTAALREKNKDRLRQTESAHRILKELCAMTLPVPMSSKRKWQLNKTHVKVAFRNCGLELKEEALTMPTDKITTVGEYIVQVTVNKMHTVDVKMLVYHHHKNIQPDLPPVWSTNPKHQFIMEEVLAAAAEKMMTKNKKRENIL